MNLDPEITDLIIERATCGLSAADQKKLDQLVQSSSDPNAVLKAAEQFELSIAALELSQLENTSAEQAPSLSATLQEKIRLQASDAIDSFASTDDRKLVSRQVKTADAASSLRRHTWKDVLIWTVAAASLLALALFIRQSADTTQISPENIAVNELEPPMDLVEDIMPNDELMKKFLGSSPEDLLTLSWTPVDNKDVTGEVFWSDQRQTGFMTLNGMEINDPQQKQYQVWIYDTEAKEQRPVNGGVFDVSKTGRYIVPIAPLSPVKEAVQFAITSEQPGGVEVSDQKNVSTVASKPF